MLRAYVDPIRATFLVGTGLDEVRLEGRALAVWREEHLAFRKHGSKRNGVAVVGWRTPMHEGSTRGGDAPAARYTITLSPDAAAELAVTGDSLLVFSIADSGQKPPLPEEEDGEGKDEEEKKEKEEEDGKEPLDLSVELTATDGVRSRIVLSHTRMMPILLESRFTKLPIEKPIFGPVSEPTLQTFEVPMSVFIEAAPDFDPGALATISFVFDQSPEGVIFLDDIGFADPTPASSEA